MKTETHGSIQRKNALVWKEGKTHQGRSQPFFPVKPERYNENCMSIPTLVKVQRKDRLLPGLPLIASNRIICIAQTTV